MKNIFNLKNLFTSIFFLLLLFIPFTSPQAQENKLDNSSKNFCAVYFTGIGCPHCAKTDPLVLGEIPNKYDNSLIIEYEIYQSNSNAKVLSDYTDSYNLSPGIPQIVLGNNQALRGDRKILDNLENKVRSSENKCPTRNGELKSFADLDISRLPYDPKLWGENRVLVKKGEGGENDFLKKLLTAKNPSKIISEAENYSTIEDKTVALSGSDIEFEHAVGFDGWVFKWNGSGVGYANNGGNSGVGAINNEELNTEFTWVKIVSLALVDAVNPCAFAVLILMLTTILTYNPKNRKNIIFAGLAFIAAVFLMYLFYGLVIIKFMQVVQALTSIRLWMYKIFGLLAVLLGLLNIKDFISYKPGTLGTEMPLSMRPKVKKLITGVTTPTGAFIVGLFVTLFLLPCTIGPYIICCGVLSVKNIMQSLPPLVLYNLIFVLPMLVIVAVVYLGLRQVSDVSEWKERNIHKLHLFAGLVMLALGIAMLLGWV